MNLDDFIIWLYLRTEEVCKEIPAFERLRERGPPPGLSDIEVIVIEILGSYS